VAGVADIDARTFALWNVVGGVAWTLGVTLAGYGLGSTVHGIDKYILPVIALIVLVSLVPVLLEVRRRRMARSG
jgi:membrane-associated protein